MFSPLLGLIFQLNGKKGNHCSTGLLGLPCQLKLWGAFASVELLLKLQGSGKLEGSALASSTQNRAVSGAGGLADSLCLSPTRHASLCCPFKGLHVRAGRPQWPQGSVSLRMTTGQGESFPGVKKWKFQTVSTNQDFRLWLTIPLPTFFFFFFKLLKEPRNVLGSVLSHSECIAIWGPRFMCMWGGFLLDSPSWVGPRPYVLPQSTLGCDNQSLRTGWAHVLLAHFSFRATFPFLSPAF